MGPMPLGLSLPRKAPDVYRWKGSSGERSARFTKVVGVFVEHIGGSG